MGKTPKRADPSAPGGDERNSCVRGSSLQERQRESDNPNRPKLSSIQKKVYPSSRKRLKGKSRGFTKCSSPSNIDKESKTETTEDSTPTQSNMQPEPEEPEVKLDVVNKKNICEETTDDVDNKIAEIVSKDSNANCTTEEQSDSASTTTVIETKTPEMPEKNISAEECSKSQEEATENENESIKENGKQLEEHEQEREEIQLTLRVEESPVQSEEAVFESKEEDNKTEDISNAKETNESTNEMKTTQTESQADTESCSVDLVESTTSELPEMTSQSSEQQQDSQKREEKRESSVNIDTYGVSYDSSITLRDVKIQLSDCLKDTKCTSMNNGDDGTVNLPPKDMSFGKTLRSISGRHSIKRLQHVSSFDALDKYSLSRFHSKAALSLSLPQEAVTDTKILRYRTGVSESFSTNGGSAERKRKLESQDWNTTKKRKTDTESSLLNASMGLLRGLRKPIQVSTSNVTYGIHSDKVNVDNLNDSNDKLLSTRAEGTKKWCVIM